MVSRGLNGRSYGGSGSSLSQKIRTLAWVMIAWDQISFNIVYDIIFLAGSFDIGNYMSHEVIVPYGKALFFPLINAINSFSEDPEMKTKEDLIKWSKKDIEIIAKKELVINGEPLSAATSLLRTIQYRVPAKQCL